jgi:S-adenosyl-L-methionine hydrolase (adenosine-forming)
MHWFDAMNPASYRADMPGAARPIITLTSDFGLEDYYVAAMKAVLLTSLPDAQLIDVTHQIPPQDILAGAIALERAISVFPPGTVHLAVVDPGVGTGRRLLIAHIRTQWVICPDNGLITWAWRRQGGGACYELTWRPVRSSATFHGRDVMAPAAGMLAAGRPVEQIARPLADPVLLDIAPADPSSDRGRIIHLDHFGNATTNVPADHPRLAAGAVRVGDLLLPLHRTYQDVSPGAPLALIGSSDLLEIAVRDGSAVRELKLDVGEWVQLAAE